MAIRAVDFEFIDLGSGGQLGLSMGMSGGSTGQPLAFGIGHSSNDLTGALFGMAEDTNPTKRLAGIASARGSLGAMHSSTPGHGAWTDAIDQMEIAIKSAGRSPVSEGDISQIAQDLSKELGSAGLTADNKINFQGDTIVGSNFRQADQALLEKYGHNYNPQTTDLVNPTNPAGAFKDHIAQFGDDPYKEFEKQASAHVNADLSGRGYSQAQISQLEWGSNPGQLRRGTWGLEDMFTFTGGKAEHGNYIVEQMVKAGHHDFTLDMVGSSSAHGALYDAIVTELVYNRLGKMAGDTAAITAGTSAIMASRASAAMGIIGKPANPITPQAKDPLKEAVKDIEPPPNTAGRQSQKSANKLRNQENFGKVIQKFRNSDFANSIKKSAVGRKMKGRWTTVAAVAVASTLVGGLAANTSQKLNKGRAGMPRNYISTDKLSQAMAMGGAF
tara:strand:- start:182 stop:1510 length:1329 start_codon:yes stop_codon:yes gene_type:complete